MSKASRLTRPPSAGAVSKLPSPRKECPGTAALTGQARLLSVGEKLMRAGTDSMLTRQKSLPAAGPQDKAQSDALGPGEAGPTMECNPPKSRISLPKASRQEQGSGQKQTKSNLRVTSPGDTENVTRRQGSPNGTPASRSDAKVVRSVPRRHTLGGARSSREILAMQPPDMDKKREAFLEHLKHKYPHHATAIMGHQERLREQSRSPKHSPSPQPGIGDQVDHLSLTSLDSLEAMSEVDSPTGFTRGSRIRASLPVVRSTNQTKDRSLGVLYLQYGDETKQIRMPNEVTSIDTVRALFVSAFPQMLTMKMLESPSVAVYVKDDMRNMYYELSDVRNITDHSCLKVYHKDPAQAFNHGPRPTNGDARMHSEMVSPLRQHPMGPPAHHPLQAGLPPSPHSMPPSRIPFSPRQGSLPGNGTMPRERLSTANPPARSISPCPSAILERRDVKPDGDMGGKSHSLSRGNEGLYADPYLLQEGRMGMATAHGPGHDGPEHSMPGFHRASVRSTSSYSGPSPTDSIDHPSLYRQKSRNSQLPTLGSKTPPPSPHRRADVRIVDIHGSVPIERSSPVRQSFKKEDVTGTKPRNNMASSDLQAHLQGSIPPSSDNQTRERLSKTSSPAHSAQSSGGSPVLPAKGSTSNAVLPDKNQVPLKANLLQFRKNVSDLRMQLHQMRQLQLQNQEVLRGQLKQAEQEIGVKLAEAMRRLDDPVQKQRALVEEDRQKYLSLEERVLVQLGDLEQYVVSLQKDSSGTHRAVTLKDVEEGAVTLRKVGESLAGLKGEFPALQSRMRSVLRVEVEAVKFLKEEPHKLDSMLKRVKSLTDTLSNLRRCATEGPQRAADPSSNIPVDSSPSLAEATVVESPPASVTSGSTAHPLDSQSSAVKSEPASPVVIHHVESSLVHMQQSQQSASLSAAQPSPSLTLSPTHFNTANPSKIQGRESPKVVAVDPPSPAHHKKARGSPVNHNNRTASQDLVVEELQNSEDKRKNIAMSIEAAEKEWEEKRQNIGQYDEKEFEKIIQEAEANMIKGLPSPDAAANPGQLPANTHSPLQSTAETQRESQLDKEPKKVPEKFPKPVMEKPAKPVLERPSKMAPKPASPDSFNKLASEKATKSPPPPPPRKTFASSSTGMTTTRSGEVVYTNRKDSVSAQDDEEEGPLPAAQIKPTKTASPEPKKPATPPPVVASAVREEEDEGDKIMAELQVFQKCTVQEVGAQNVVDPTTRIEAQIRELRAGAMLPVKEKKHNSEPNRDGKDPDTDENGNTTVRQSQGVIYYVTGKIPKEPPPYSGTEETHEHRDSAQSPSQVSNVTVNDNSPGQLLSQPPKSPPSKSPPPISPKPVGLNGFKLPRKPMKRSMSLKTSAEMEKGKNLTRVNTEKKSQFVQDSVSSTKNVKLEPVAATVVRVASKGPAPPPPPRRSSSEDSPPNESLEEGSEEASLSPDLPGEEAPPPPDNIAFMITNSKVQALSCGEYQELVSAKKDSVQTVTVGGATSRGSTTADPDVPLHNDFHKKPVIIIFDEPMDIRSAYKRLSTIFECEEELDRMLAEERIDEESEESDTDRSSGLHMKAEGSVVIDGKKVSSSQEDHTSLSSSSSSLVSESTDGVSNGDGKQDGKKKFKFKFPKKQLAALTQAIRNGTKSGKKTLQVVVYEDEEESDGTVKQHKEAKRFEISRSKSSADDVKTQSPTPLKRQNSDSVCRTNEIRKNTYKTLDSLEQTIKQLETTINEMGPCSPEDPIYAEVKKGENGKVSEGVGLRRSASLPTSRGSALKLAGKSSFQKKTKPVLLPRPVVIPSTTITDPSAPNIIQQNTSVASPTSRMPVPLSAKSRQSPATTDKAAKQQKLQEAQRQFRQANGSTKRVGGDHKTTSPTVPVSKIPAFYPSTTKSTSDAFNPTNPPSSKPSLLSPHSARPTAPPSSHIPSLSNGCLKPPSQHAGKALSFSSQTQNGRVHSSSSFSSSSSSSTSPSPLSPTPLGPGGKSIRTIHTPSFTSYRVHNGSSSKSCIPTTSVAKDAI
ncbi:sickle tail protein homolog isoform X3 [Dunckerocampus dactyliophorus]|uniref:sickle tail protein homolog isoform X3 n=1 Tax=Dunckerocampus dactyliophorus TaxID=161453 RepID=UPI0024075012|nr:sickle tail protein homolog isoform X3 [Dunckerocampus dactyliophorus]